jgi:hypothetical protein
MTGERRTLSVDEFCAAYGLSHGAAYRLIDRHQLRSRKVRGRRRILTDSAVKLLSSPVSPEYLRLVEELQNLFSSLSLVLSVENYRRIKELLVLISLELNSPQKAVNITDLPVVVLDSAEAMLSRPDGPECLRLVQELRDLFSSSAGSVEMYRRGKELLVLISREMNARP